MAFKIGDGYIEVTSRVDKTQTAKAGAEAGESSGKAFGESFWRSSDGRLRDGRGRFVSDISRSAQDAGRAGGFALFGEFSKAFQAVPPHMKAVLVGGAIAASPFIGAAISGGILAGLAGVSVAGGVALAFRNPKVKAEGQAFGKFMGDELTRATTAFVPATLAGMRTLRAQVIGMEDELRDAGDAAAAFVMPFTRGLGGMVRELLPGLTSALEKSGAVVRKVEQSMQFLGQSAGKALDSIADGAAGAALALGDLVLIAGGSVQMVGSALGALSKLYSFMRVATATNKVEVVAEMAAGEAASAGFKEELARLQGQFTDTGTAAGVLTAETAALTRTTDAAATAAMSAFSAETQLAEAMREAKDAAKENNAGIEGNSEAVIRNRRALETLATATINSSAKTKELTGSSTAAVGQMNRGYDAFIKAAKGMGVGEAAAKDLARQLGLIPASKSTKFLTPGYPQVMANIKALKRSLSTIDTQIEIDIIQRLSTVGQRVTGVTGRGGHNEFAEGGPVTGGVPNRDSVPIMSMPGEYVVPKWMVPTLGGMHALESVRQRGFVGARPAPSGPVRSAPGTVHSGNVTINVNVDVSSLRTVDDLIRWFGRLEVAAKTFRAPGRMVTA